MKLITGIYARFRHLVHELAKFGSIGVIAFAITWIGTNLLHNLGWMKANAIATIVATTFAYFANRYWTFRHRDRSALHREYVIFFVLNLIGLAITELFIGFTNYTLSRGDLLANNIALIVGTGAATLFRFWSYKRWVFLAPAAPEPAEPAVTRVP